MIDARKNVRLPDAVLAAIQRRRYQYSTPVALYYAIWVDGQTFCGVFGDGANGAYEWFLWNHGKLETSDCGYGSTSVALRAVLVRAEPLDSRELHALLKEAC